MVYSFRPTLLCGSDSFYTMWIIDPDYFDPRTRKSANYLVKRDCHRFKYFDPRTRLEVRLLQDWIVDYNSVFRSAHVRRGATKSL